MSPASARVPELFSKRLLRARAAGLLFHGVSRRPRETAGSTLEANFALALYVFCVVCNVTLIVVVVVRYVLACVDEYHERARRAAYVVVGGQIDEDYVELDLDGRDGLHPSRLTSLPCGALSADQDDGLIDKYPVGDYEIM
jgi:hypothetical protein